MINPASLLSFRKDWGEFEKRHPKFVLFLKAAFQSGIGEGSVIDISVTLPDGRKLESNMKISAEDVEFLKKMGDLGGH